MSASDSDGSGSDTRSPSTAPAAGSKKKSSKSSKARLTSEQKNTNHRDAENKRRAGIHIEQETLSALIPGAQNDAKSEERLLTKTADYMEKEHVAIRNMIAECDAKGIVVPDVIRNFLKDDDFGGSRWKTPNIDNFEVKRAKAEAKRVNAANASNQNRSISPDDDD